MPQVRPISGRLRVLDVGGGRAPYAHLFQKEGALYVVLESNILSVGSSSPRFVVGDALALPFRPASFDIVLLTEVLEHIAEPKQALVQCARMLRPGGFVIVTAPQYWHVHGWSSDYYRYTRHGLEYLCSCAGFDVVRMVPMGGPGLLLYSVLVLNFCRFLWWPLLSVVLDTPIVLVCWALDAVLFRRNAAGRNPDTRGWAVLASRVT